jgi:TPR repeat protein
MKRLLLVAGLALFAAPAFAGGPGDDCDRLAASSYDIAKPAGITGVDFDKVDALSAIAACEKAVALAPNELRYTYELGRAYWVAKRDGEAFVLIRKAADAGYANAEDALGYANLNGGGVTKDEAEAAKWYGRAAEHGNPEAMSNLGFLIETGAGGEQQSYVDALAWYTKAAALGEADAEVHLGSLYQRGAGVTKDEKTAADWYRKAAETGDPMAETRYGLALGNGIGAPVNDDQAVVWFRKAADQAYPSAESALGVMYALGRGLPKDDTQAVLWLRRAAEQDDADGAYSLGIMYRDQRVVGSDPTTTHAAAVKWLKRADALGDPRAKQALSELGETVQ